MSAVLADTNASWLIYVIITITSNVGSFVYDQDTITLRSVSLSENCSAESCSNYKDIIALPPLCMGLLFLSNRSCYMAYY